MHMHIQDNTERVKDIYMYVCLNNLKHILTLPMKYMYMYMELAFTNTM